MSWQTVLIFAGIVVGAFLLYKFLLYNLRFIYAIYQGNHRVYLKVSTPRREAKKDREEQTFKNFKEC